ncbi:hypothetical protein ANME2D_02652 [Candidatus Methanoperedens nitroreducens]|uniref:L-2-amino-thiazoline-4-carboxylic acid hydrolase n=1 Tax=Candidatus Methanoperedens nitratireducens TaxID=1392998 RepID=A0A062UUC3_9EURY|nr:L-2-amino-thiazoline-4-carboxylic acid hydrolase [Candidatus Methanoperedens nitroreducens]KCZ70631.1 hypothetical protein ANME2D_02652 [Candidatus Methanoperedens nitroreducens]MDJ1420487.1 L-2-amino-thiazoline-4-carboxylic acid hydrolase [Candidatus Methanoperedens sp.]
MIEIGKPKIRSGERPAVRYAAYAADTWEKEGEEALEAISKAQYELGIKYAAAQIKAQGLKGKDASAAGAIYINLLQELSVVHSIIENTNNSFIVRTKGCPFFHEWKTAGVDPLKLCESFGNSFMQGLCEGVNPGLRYSITRSMSGGSPYCEKRIDLK